MKWAATASEAINAIRASAAALPAYFTDRLIRPGTRRSSTSSSSYMGYRTCYYRTFNVDSLPRRSAYAYRKAREWMDVAIDLLKPGISSRPDVSAAGSAAATSVRMNARLSRSIATSMPCRRAFCRRRAGAEVANPTLKVR